MNGSPADDEVLIVVDPQRDFCPGGALAVPAGDEIMPIVNRLARQFAHVILTQDWHPPGHGSFASAHPGRQPFETIEGLPPVDVVPPGCPFHPRCPVAEERCTHLLPPPTLRAGGHTVRCHVASQP